MSNFSKRFGSGGSSKVTPSNWLQQLDETIRKKNRDLALELDITAEVLKRYPEKVTEAVKNEFYAIRDSLNLLVKDREKVSKGERPAPEYQAEQLTLEKRLGAFKDQQGIAKEVAEERAKRKAHM